MPSKRHGFFFDTIMSKQNNLLYWLPAMIMMAMIFYFSSQPAVDLPNFNWADGLVKKSGHVIGYALLASSYWYGLETKKDRLWLAWLLAILYALTDEYHQIFTAGRHPSIWDVLIFDDIGALIGLWIFVRHRKRKTQTD